MSTTPPNDPKAILDAIAAEALAPGNEALYAQLIQDPKAVLSRYFNTEGLEIVVHQNTQNVVHLVLPAPEAEIDVEVTRGGQLHIRLFFDDTHF